MMCQQNMRGELISSERGRKHTTKEAFQLYNEQWVYLVELLLVIDHVHSKIYRVLKF